MKLVVVGSVGLDDIETPSGSVERALGGSATYFSLASAFFTNPGFVGIVGSDFPQDGIELLASHGVDLRGLERVDGPTFRWSGRYHADINERDTLLTELGVFEGFQPKLPADYRKAPVLFLGNIHPSLQSDVLDQADGKPFVALDTMNFWIEGTPDELAAVLPRIDALLINDSEARMLAGTANTITAARRIAAMGPSLVVIKRGEFGAFAYRNDSFFFVPAFPLENVVDPTGAGDCFAGGMIGYLAKAGNTDWATVKNAMVAGSVVASFSVEGFSVERLRTVTREDIDARWSEFRKLTHFDADL